LLISLSDTKKRARGPCEFSGGAFGVDPNAPLLKGIYACAGESARVESAITNADPLKYELNYSITGSSFDPFIIRIPL
jgi:hypothetical protein